MLLNLAGNAVKFTETGGALLGVEAHDAKTGRVRLRFTVRDTGPGIPKAQQKRIFQAYAQAEAAHAARADSTGLGLAIVRELVRRGGGDVTLADTAGGGLTVRVTLPAAPAPDQDGVRPAPV